MVNTVFILTLTLVMLFLFQWGFRKLPKEKWQFLGSIPKAKTSNGEWQGVNFTYYGFFNASAYVFATALFFILLGSVEIPLTGIFSMTLTVFFFCMPASKIIARIVEKKPATFSVGGASFVGILITPWIAWLIQKTLGNQMGFIVPVGPVLAAVSISYAFGEGIGRLACISFGCCYGKPLSEVHPILRHLFKERSFIFTGETKKISYAHGLDNQKILPIQAITAIILTFCGLLGLCFYLMGNYTASFLVTLVITQCWRFLSEFLRADYRGGGKLSAYQLMGLCSVPYAVFIVLLFGQSVAPAPEILSGLRGFWDPGVVLFLEWLWLITFLFTGRSEVTGSTLSFFVIKEKI
jgi:hypothetical protein